MACAGNLTMKESVWGPFARRLGAMARENGRKHTLREILQGAFVLAGTCVHVCGLFVDVCAVVC